MMIYTLIHYRPNGADYCRGCLMGTSDSEIEIVNFADIEEAAKSIAEKRMIDETSDREYAGWETTILIDGYTDANNPLWDNLDIGGAGNPDYPDPYSKLEEAADAAFKILQAEAEARKIAEEAAKLAATEAKKLRDAEAAEARDKAEYERLSRKYG